MPGSSFKVKALYEYKSEEPDDLSFRDGQIITVTDEEDADWYTGEYIDESGERREGIFPRNFVEKFEPAIPTRPARAPKRPPVHEAPVEHAAETPPAQAPAPAEPLQSPSLDETSSSKDAPISGAQAVEEPVEPAPAPKPAAPSPTVAAKSPPPPSTSKPPPPVADKPSSSSFKDRIAAFNKPAAAPITPFKPGGSTSTGFIKKPFVAPPPSRNAYVPPPREQPVQKSYRREEDTSSLEIEAKEAAEPTSVSQAEPSPEDQPKPQSLKDRIALLQKQQMEQAARNAEKKDKPKKPPKKRVEHAEILEDSAPSEPPVLQTSAEDDFRRPSIELAEDESDVAPLSRRGTGVAGVTPQPQPIRELVSDTNDADDSGAGDDEDVQETSTEEERPKSKGADSRTMEANKQNPAPADQDEDGDEDEDEEEDEEEEDPEVRRRRELRERMAKMSGGMGMMGMFGPPGGIGAPGARKPKSAETRQTSEPQPLEVPEERPAPVRIMALPGMSNMASKPQEEPAEDSGDETAQATPQEPCIHEEPEDYISRPIERRSTDRPAPPIPQATPAAPPRETRAVPPPPPSSSRPNPPSVQSPTSRPPPPLPPTGPSAAETPVNVEEDEAELSGEEGIPGQPSAANGPTGPTSAPPPPPPIRVPEPPRANSNDFTTSPATDKRASRPPPPVPVSPTVASPQTRAPPPPPPGLPPVRRSTSDSRGFGVSQGLGADASDEDEVTEYDGDYDTDIASGAKHKDALKSHNRDSSLDDDMLTDDATKSLKSPTARTAPPMPPIPAPAPRDVPPPPPSQPAPKSRSSMDAPRAAPPPVPPPKVADDEEYDPYRYSGSQHGLPLHPTKTQYSTKLQSPKEELEEDDMYGASSPPGHIPPPPAERSAPPPPPPERPEYGQAPTGFAPPLPAVSPRPSLDVKRSGTVSRRSMEQSRTSGEQSYIAHDIDLGRGSMWWAQESMPPPSLQGRQDILLEMETSSSTKRGGRTTVTRGIYVLYMDYSQTTINASFDAADPSHVTLDQNHERPPPAPRRDQLENASAQYGSQIAKAATSVLGLSLADGSAQGLILELLKPHTTALRPVGTRAYGALVYANLGNASTQQYDEIRPGDIVTFRNAKFAGHTGTMHSKYSIDVGKPEHVAIVAEWDGTKKKIRALEQGRDLEKGKKPKLREHSFKVGDLKSGEVMVWRVMPRTWVGWDSGK